MGQENIRSKNTLETAAAAAKYKEYFKKFIFYDPADPMGEFEDK
jgi:hypothetical protein